MMVHPLQTQKFPIVPCAAHMLYVFVLKPQGQNTGNIRRAVIAEQSRPLRDGDVIEAQRRTRQIERSGALTDPNFCLIFALYGYDESEIFPSESLSICLTGADGEQ